MINNSIDDSSWDIKGNNLFDKFIEQQISPILPLKIIDIIESDNGDVSISFEKNISLTIFVNSSEIQEEWRFINNNTGEHYVYRED